MQRAAQNRGREKDGDKLQLNSGQAEREYKLCRS